MQMVRRGSVYNFEAPQSADPGSFIMEHIQRNTDKAECKSLHPLGR